MKRILKNTNPVNHPLSNFMAYLLLLIALSLKIIPMFVLVNEPVDDFFIYLIGALGLVLIFIPDEFASILRRTLNFYKITSISFKILLLRIST